MEAIPEGLTMISLADVEACPQDPISQARGLALAASRIVDDDCTAERMRWRLALALQLIANE
jgi:hypothetical protein